MHYFTLFFKGAWIKDSKEEQEVQEKINHIHAFVRDGRSNKDALKGVLPILAFMCLEEQSRTQKYSAASDYKKRLPIHRMNREINGKVLSELMTSCRVSMFMLVVDNYLARDSSGNAIGWPCQDGMQKYTKPQEVAKSGGWSKEGIEQYKRLLEREIKQRKEMKNKYINNKEERPDYFSYEPRQEEGEEMEDIDEEDEEAIALPDDASDDEINVIAV